MNWIRQKYVYKKKAENNASRYALASLDIHAQLLGVKTIASKICRGTNKEIVRSLMVNQRWFHWGVIISNEFYSTSMNLSDGQWERKV